MRRCLMLLTLVLAVILAAPPVHSEAPVPNGLISNIQKCVSQQLATSLYGWTKEQRTAQLAKLKKQYAPDFKQLKKLAAAGNAMAKKLDTALTQFESNLESCSKCEHAYRNLQIDLRTFEGCKLKYCDVVNAAWEKIASFARAAKTK